MEELIIVERKNGWYGGYTKTKNGYNQEFNTDKHLLFWSIKQYTDKGYKIKCVDSDMEEKLRSGKPTLQEYLGL